MAIERKQVEYNYAMDHDEFDLIVSDPQVLEGKPCIGGTRLSVQFILELIASGGTTSDILRGWPDLTPDAIEQAVRYAARFLENESSVAGNAAR